MKKQTLMGFFFAGQNVILQPLSIGLFCFNCTYEIYVEFLLNLICCVCECVKDFRMETYAGPVFASLRRSLGMTEKEYQQSLSSEGNYLQFISNSKSKADFFLT